MLCLWSVACIYKASVVSVCHVICHKWMETRSNQLISGLKVVQFS